MEGKTLVKPIEAMSRNGTGDVASLLESDWS